VLKFGAFELNDELKRNGTVVHLPPQPLQILTLLVRNAGEIVDRNRIRTEVWGETAVDFDRSLNVAVAQIRTALNDDAENPRFIQTVPRKGYRFVAPVEQPAPPKPRTRMVAAIALGVVLSAGLAGAAYRLLRPAPGPLRIAVLPFENDAIFDQLLTSLGGIAPDRLQVIGRRSVEYWNAHGSGGLRDLGDRLKVRYAIESTARSDRRVTVRLVDTTSEAVIWSGTFEEEETLVARVSAAVLTTLLPGTSARAPESNCGPGREAFQTGRLLANRGGIKDLERSLTFYQQAGCAAARGAYAETMVRLARIGTKPPEWWETARLAAQSGDGAAAHLALGNVAFWRDWKWDTARREYEQALRINPSNPDAHHDIAWLDAALGMRAQALESLETAIAIDPLSARTRIDSAWLLMQIGRFDEAAKEARRTLELEPDMKEAQACLNRALLYSGNGAKVTIRDGSDPYDRAWRLSWLGKRDEALSALEEAFRVRSLMMPLVAVDPGFASVRSDPRFRKIVADMGL